MGNSNKLSRRRNRRKIKIQRPQAESHETESVWEDVRRFAKMVPEAPDPNFGRLQEIKDEIKNGTYLTQQMLDDTASILSIRIMKGEIDSHLEL